MFLALGVTRKFDGGPVGTGGEKWSILTFIINSILHPFGWLAKPAHLTPSCGLCIAYFILIIALAEVEV